MWLGSVPNETFVPFLQVDRKKVVRCTMVHCGDDEEEEEEDSEEKSKSGSSSEEGETETKTETKTDDPEEATTTKMES